jgi:hypothetical protein
LFEVFCHAFDAPFFEVGFVKLLLESRGPESVEVVLVQVEKHEGVLLWFREHGRLWVELFQLQFFLQFYHEAAVESHGLLLVDFDLSKTVDKFDILYEGECLCILEVVSAIE